MISEIFALHNSFLRYIKNVRSNPVKSSGGDASARYQKKESVPDNNIFAKKEPKKKGLEKMWAEKSESKNSEKSPPKVKTEPGKKAEKKRDQKVANFFGKSSQPKKTSQPKKEARSVKKEPEPESEEEKMEVDSEPEVKPEAVPSPSPKKKSPKKAKKSKRHRRIQIGNYFINEKCSFFINFRSETEHIQFLQFLNFKI